MVQGLFPFQLSCTFFLVKWIINNIKKMAKTMDEFLEKFEEPEKSICISEFPEVEIIHLVNWRAERRIYNGQEKKVTFCDFADRKVRLPVSVIIQLKNLKIKYPNLKKITVKKTGSGLDSRYEVIALDKGEVEEIPFNDMKNGAN